MVHNIEFSKELILLTTKTHRINTDFVLKEISFHFLFYYENYTAIISKEKTEKSFDFIESDGPTELLDDFIEEIKNEHWNKIEKIFSEHEAKHKKNYGV